MCGDLTTFAHPLTLFTDASSINTGSVSLVGVAANIGDTARVTGKAAVNATKAREALARTIIANTVGRTVVARHTGTKGLLARGSVVTRNTCARAVGHAFTLSAAVSRAVVLDKNASDALISIVANATILVRLELGAAAVAGAIHRTIFDGGNDRTVGSREPLVALADRADTDTVTGAVVGALGASTVTSSATEAIFARAFPCRVVGQWVRRSTDTMSRAVVELDGASGRLNVTCSPRPVVGHAKARGGVAKRVTEAVSRAIVRAGVFAVYHAAVGSLVSLITGANTIQAHAVTFAVIGAVIRLCCTIVATISFVTDACTTSALTLTRTSLVGERAAIVRRAVTTFPSFFTRTLGSDAVPMAAAIVFA